MGGGGGGGRKKDHSVQKKNSLIQHKSKKFMITRNFFLFTASVNVVSKKKIWGKPVIQTQIFSGGPTLLASLSTWGARY